MIEDGETEEDRRRRRMITVITAKTKLTFFNILIELNA